MSLMYLERNEIDYLNNLAFENIEFLLDNLNVEYKFNSGSIVCSCPVHGGKNKNALAIFMDGHTIKGNWVCHSHHCELTFISSTIGLFRGILSHQRFGWFEEGDQKVSLSEAFDYLCKILKADFKNMKILRKESSFEKYSHFFNNVNKSGVHDYAEKDIKDRLDTPSKYFISRGFSPEILTYYGVGDTIAKGKLFSNRAVVPVHDEKNGAIVGFTARTTFDRCVECNNYHSNDGCNSFISTGKWINSKGFSKKDYLYNYGNAIKTINETGVVILVEGPADVWKFVENGIKNVCAVFGSSVTDSQQILLESSRVTTLISMFDSDVAGNKASRQVTKSLSRMFNVVGFPLPEGVNDPGELTSDQINNFVKPFIERYYN